MITECGVGQRAQESKSGKIARGIRVRWIPLFYKRSYWVKITRTRTRTRTRTTTITSNGATLSNLLFVLVLLLVLEIGIFELDHNYLTVRYSYRDRKSEVLAYTRCGTSFPYFSLGSLTPKLKAPPSVRYILAT